MPEVTESELKRLNEIVNSHDTDRAIAEFADDATYELPLLPEPLKGKEAIRTFISGVYTAFPDYHSEARKFLISGNEFITIETITGTQQGPFVGPDGKPAPATQRKVSVDQVTHMVLDQKGKIKSARIYGNPAEVYKQLGLLR
jgi:steroid delta-isomerase-like uncharacterized protein